jgi:GTP-binding protein EngB required for normal cell division
MRYRESSGGVRLTPFAANNSCSDWSGSAAIPSNFDYSYPAQVLEEDGLDRTLSSHQSVIDLVGALAARYQISAIRPLLGICRAATNRSHLTVAVLGRFKAGKSSFINHLVGRDLLPVGVVPVTSVITEVAYAPVEQVEIRFSDGHQVQARLADIRSYVTEAENPQNVKSVLAVSVHVPELSRWRNIHLVDTPGLESAFAHNTETSQEWAPNADIALVAIGVDPPFSQQDVELISRLLKYTPHLAVLLTKVDVLSDAEQREVVDFVRTELARRFTQQIPVYPYSTRFGYEELQREMEQNFLAKIGANLAEQRHAIVNQKAATLLRECEDYIRLTLKSAEMLDSERLALRHQVSAERDAFADTKLEIQLTARHAAAGARQVIEKVLTPYEAKIRGEILEALDRERSSFPNQFARTLEFFEKWVGAALSSRLATLSEAKRHDFVQPLNDVQRRYQRLLQSFRDRLSERTMALYGVPLRTTEPEITPKSPRKPDIKIGRVFDHNWELLSPIIPMSLLRKVVLRRFRRKIADETFKNFSRLTTQWDEIVRSAVSELQQEAEARLENLIATVERLTSATEREAPQIRADLEQLEATAATIGTEQ